MVDEMSFKFAPLPPIGVCARASKGHRKPGPQRQETSLTDPPNLTASTLAITRKPISPRRWKVIQDQVQTQRRPYPKSIGMFHGREGKMRERPDIETCHVCWGILEPEPMGIGDLPGSIRGAERA
ncbi:hypothetical protein U1Q18_002193 [Sarracenia purpurea var. burkii]